MRKVGEHTHDVNFVFKLLIYILLESKGKYTQILLFSGL